MSPESSSKVGWWTFPRAMMAVLAVCVAVEGAAGLVRALVSDPTPARWTVACAFGVSAVLFLLLNLQAVAAAFRSVKVGVTVLVFLFTGSCLGVLFKQADPYAGPVDTTWDSEADTWSDPTTRSFYDEFAGAQAFFTYHLLHPMGWGLPDGNPPESALDSTAKVAGARGPEIAKSMRIGMAQAFAAQARRREVIEHLDGNRAAYRALFRFACSLDFVRAYRSDWFTSLCCLLFGVVLTQAIVRRNRGLLRVEMLGFTCAHLGVMTVLAGGGYSRLTEVRGILPLKIGQSADQFFDYDGGRPRPLPFAVRLEDFHADYRPVLDVWLPGVDAEVRHPAYPMRDGVRILLDRDPEGRAQRRLLVQEVVGRAQIVPRLVEAEPGEAAHPVLELEDPDGGSLYRLAGASPADLFLSPDNAFKVRFLWEPDEAALAAALREARTDRTGDVVVTVAGEEAVRVPAVRGSAAVHGDVRVEVLDVTGNFKLTNDPTTGRTARVPMPADLGAYAHEQPAVEVQVSRDGVPEPRTRFVFARFDLGSHQVSYAYEEVAVRLTWDEWLSPTRSRYLLVGREDGSEWIDAASGSSQPVAWETVVLPGLRPLRVLGQAAFRADITQHPDSEEFFHHDPASVEIRYERRSPGSSEWLPAGTVRLATEQGLDAARLDEGLTIRLRRDTSGFPREWKSLLGIQEGGVSLSGIIRVNDYFKHRGWRFFQTDARPEDPTYSGVGVVYDPGIPPVVTGLYMIMGSVFWAFLVKPAVLRRRRKTA